VFFCPVLEIKKLGHPKVKNECTVSLRGDVEAVALKQICKPQYEFYEEKKKIRDTLGSSYNFLGSFCTKNNRRHLVIKV